MAENDVKNQIMSAIWKITVKGVAEQVRKHNLEPQDLLWLTERITTGLIIAYVEQEGWNEVAEIMLKSVQQDLFEVRSHIANNAPATEKPQ